MYICLMSCYYNMPGLLDFTVFMEYGCVDLPDISIDPRFFPPRLTTPWKDCGLVFAECGCLDHWKTFKHVMLYHVNPSRTFYHEPSCLLAGFPMEHLEVSIYIDELRPSTIIDVVRQNAILTKKGCVKLHEYNWYDHDTIGRFSDYINSRLASLNKVQMARNWA